MDGNLDLMIRIARWIRIKRTNRTFYEQKSIEIKLRAVLSLVRTRRYKRVTHDKFVIGIRDPFGSRIKYFARARETLRSEQVSDRARDRRVKVEYEII